VKRRGTADARGYTPISPIGSACKSRQADSNRTAFAERAARDIEIINRNAKRLNAEALEVLGYQRIP
jgi:hypothetical protein